MWRVFHKWRRTSFRISNAKSSLQRCLSSSAAMETIWQRVKFLPMPQLSPTMNKGSILKWHVGEGKEVASYDLVLELTANGLTSDTEANGRKVSMDIEIIEDMHVGKLIVTSPDEECKVGTPLAIFCDDKNDVQLLQSNDKIVHQLIKKYENQCEENKSDKSNSVISSVLWQGYLKPEEKGREDVAGCGCS